MKHEPGLQEDAKNLSLVTASGLAAVLLTLGLLANQVRATPERVVVHEAQPVVVEVVEIPEVVEPEPVVEVTRVPLNGAQRLYGTVRTVYGSEFTGFIRWDRNEGSTVDLLDATKARRRGSSSQSGIRFGHVESIEPLDGHSALFTLRSGDRVKLGSNASDLGNGLRALVVDEGNGHIAEFSWRDLDEVRFLDPEGETPSENRLYGTLMTRDGMRFSGFITWDVDEIYTTDILDGDLDGERLKIEFGDIARIERHSSWGAQVTLRDGESMILEGTNDVDSSIRNISVSDPTLGQVLLEWRDFDMVEFHAQDDPALLRFDGGRELQGTVVTQDGRELSGTITWDADEQFTWEILQGDVGSVQFSIEFGNIDTIERNDSGARVTLLDGRMFDLRNGNDIDHGNRGISIRTDGREFEIAWRDFASLRLDH